VAAVKTLAECAFTKAGDVCLLEMLMGVAARAIAAGGWILDPA